MSDRGQQRARGRGQGSAAPRGQGFGQGSYGPSGRGNTAGQDRGRGFMDRGRGFSDRGRGHSDRGGGSSNRGRGGGRGQFGSVPTPSLQIFQSPSGAVPSPDSSVTALESSLVSSQSTQLLSDIPDISALSLDQRVPPRPAYGTRGEQITLWANYFNLMPQPEMIIYRYSIEITPDPKGSSTRYQIIQLLLEQGRLSEAKPAIASDFQSTFICASRLSNEQMNLSVELDEGKDSKKYKVGLAFTGSFAVGDLIDFLTGTNASRAFSDKHEITQALNIILGHHPKARSPESRYSKLNKHFIIRGPTAEQYDLKSGLQAWRGFFMSVRAATGRLLVNVQVKHAAMYKACRLDELMREFLSGNAGNLRKLAVFVRGVRIDRLHLKKGSNRSAKPQMIRGLAAPGDGRQQRTPPRVKAFGATPSNLQFHLGPGKQYVSLKQYFSSEYKIQCSDDLPVLKVGPDDDPRYLPAEVCVVLPAQPANSKLSPDQTAGMIRFAVRQPFVNAESINGKGLADLALNGSNELLNAFGLSVGLQMITVQGRILPCPNLRYAKNASLSPRFGSWNMGNHSFSKGAHLPKWSILWIRSSKHRDPWERNLERLKNTLDQFLSVLQRMDINLQEPLVPGKIIEIDTSNNPQENQAVNKHAVESGFEELMNRGRKESLLLVLLPDQSEIYHTIKQCGDLRFGVHTVCVISPKFAKPNNAQYFANVALKINLKMGGNNQLLDPAKLGFIGQGKTMLVGIDVTHPSPGSTDDSPSVAGMVASIDKNLGQFPAILKVQQRRKEMVTDIADMLKSRLALWRKQNSNALPANILVYRDGVSEGDYVNVLDKELPILKTACQEIYPANSKQPAISIVVVGKRHHTRFYPTDKSKIDEHSANTRNGTIVDRGVTESGFWDFFLQAHTAIKGTARPAHYFVVHDEIFTSLPLPPGFRHAGDILEDVTHNISYMFGRATRAVSVCPPAYYADLLCERSRSYLSHLFSPNTSQAGSVVGGSNDPSADIQVHPNLKDSMFYI